MSLGEAARERGATRPDILSGALERLLAYLPGAGGDNAATQRAALIAFAIRVVSAGIAFFSQVLLARWMGSFEYGIFVFIWVWVLILGGLAALGLSTACMRFVPEYRETKRFALLRGLLSRTRWIAVSSSTLVALTGCAGLIWFGHMLSGHYLLPAFLILFCLPMFTLVDVQDGIARGYGWMNVALVPPYILRPLLLLGAMAGVYAAGQEMSAVNAAGAAIFACWGAAMFQSWQLARHVGADMDNGPRAYQTGLWISTALPLLLVHGFVLLLMNTDILVLARYSDPTQVAVYFAALKTISLVAFVHFAVGAAAANRFSAHKARGERVELQSAVRDTVRWTFWPSLAGTVILLALGKPLLWLFGAEFTSAYPVMFVLAVGLIIRAAMGPVEMILNMLGEQKLCAFVLFGSAGINLALNFALIPAYGLMGAASATAFSMALGAICMAIAAHRRLGLNCFIWRRPLLPSP
ncbi:MAG: polysaccharide biosynthesis C-terminal domain-containing protein [Proteobacteria bacterium]|nr:polysaccharide biosynthesis C-terminal domain-containing protein [Pseudomonadota bacterium]